MSKPVIMTTLEQRFGPIDQPFVWFSRNQEGLSTVLDPFEELVNKNGVLEGLDGSAGLNAAAYITARLFHGRDNDHSHDWFGVGAAGFGVVATIGEVEYVQQVLGIPFEHGVSDRDTSLKRKANFLSPDGLLATVRQGHKGMSSGFVVNRGGFAEIAFCELLPEVQDVVLEFAQKQRQ